MIRQIKKYLKSKTKEEIKQIVQHPDLSETEKWLIYYTYAEKRMVINTCHKLSISERHYHFLKTIALIKLYYILHIKTAQF